MNKREFLDILRESLNGEISASDIEDNIRYYEQYINSNIPGNEEKTINELGDPRLIARTIIEADKMSRAKGKYSEGYYYSNQYTNEQEDNSNTNQSNGNFNNTFFTTNLKWYHKAAIALIVFLVFLTLLFLGGVIFRILLTFGFPILLIILLFYMLRRH